MTRRRRAKFGGTLPPDRDPMSTRHLDMGCGPAPRNPYGQAELHAVDLVIPAGADPGRFRRANLSLEPIPAPDSTFDSVSAFDFLEHIPRVLPAADGRSTRFPFVELMDEVHRVLRPGGRFYAVTPAFPRPEAFVDPTHVNVITDRTWTYFCGPQPTARLYGYRGAFELLRNEWAHFPEAYAASPVLPWRRRLSRWWNIRRGRHSHLLWEFACVKPAS
jgi:SAM-dependent methyltransferase